MTNQEQAELDKLAQHYREDFTPDVTAGLASLHARLAQNDTNRTITTTGARGSRRSFLGIAAAIALLIFAVLGYQNWTSSEGALYQSGDTALHITLPDGTAVLLNAYSELAVSDNYGEFEREITLKGEGFFEVIKNPAQPFMVRQGDVSLEVVGTSFNLLTTPENGFFEVEVATGKVMLEAGEERIPVAANECGTYRPKKGLSRMKAPHLNRHAWRTGEMVFVKTPFSEVLNIIEHAYRISFAVDPNEMKACDFELTASFKDTPLEVVIKELELLCQGDIVLDEQTANYRIENWCDPQ